MQEGTAKERDTGRRRLFKYWVAHAGSPHFKEKEANQVAGRLNCPRSPKLEGGRTEPKQPDSRSCVIAAVLKARETASLANMRIPSVHISNCDTGPIPGGSESRGSLELINQSAWLKQWTPGSVRDPVRKNKKESN